MSLTKDDLQDIGEETIGPAYHEVFNEQPPSELDKVIIAAAVRQCTEASADRVSDEGYSESLLARFRVFGSLIAAGVMTLAMANLVIPLFYRGIDDSVIISEQNQAAEVTLIDKVVVEANLDQTNNLSARTARSVPSASELLENIEQASRQTVTPKAVLSADQVVAKMRGNEALAMNQWAAEIEALAAAGEFDQMNKELADFIKQYPEYPILKQLERYLE
ncbi:MAG: hypothetical protein V2I33_03275 [Kangiellaceae bacterium]|jgi:hypothetical protein|nr:hypothetical protein [Kangiellaceae bacterium]